MKILILSILGIAGVILVTVAFFSYFFEKKFKDDVAVSLNRTQKIQPEILTEGDLEHLPPPVQKYLRYIGVLNRPKVKNFRLNFEGKMRNRGEDWFSFKSEQFNFFDEPERFFFMKANGKGLPAAGYHFFSGGKASMLVKLLSLFPVVSIDGEDSVKAETVTVFNDIALFAPAVLTSDFFRWKAIDSLSANAFFTCRGITVSAVLYFNETGQLVNFVSDDRLALENGELKNYRFSTPVKNYKNFNGLNLCSHGEAVWHYPEGEFVYGQINVKNVEFNCELN